MTLKTHSQALPRGKDNALTLIKRVLSLSGVQEIRIRPNEIFIEREVDDEEPVLPKEKEDTDNVDIEYLLSRVELTALPPDAGANPYYLLEQVTRSFTDDDLMVCGIVAPRDILADYFDLVGTDGDPTHIMGIRVLYFSSEKSEEYAYKLVIFGGPTIYTSDATRGVIIDMGV